MPPQTRNPPMAAIVLSPLTDEEADYHMHTKRARGKPKASSPPPMKIASDAEMDFAMHQILFNLNVNSPNYYSLANEGDRRWTFLGFGTEYIEVVLSSLVKSPFHNS